MKNERLVSARAMYAEGKPSDELTWAICERSCHGDGTLGCKRCPASYRDASNDEVIDGCRMMAEEGARAAMVQLRREGWKAPQEEDVAP